MPTYEYRCPHCGTAASLRRLFSEMDEPAECLSCGHGLERVFSPNGNIQIPIHFRQFLEGGAPGGGGLSWSDFHEVSEREMAKTYPTLEPANRMRSRTRHRVRS